MLPPRTIRSRFRFNPSLGTTGRYIDTRGQMVKGEIITREMEAVIGGIKGEMLDLSKQLQGGTIGLQEWYDGMRGRMKAIHTTSAAITKGGWGQMTPSDWGAVGPITKMQYQKLNNFAVQIADGLPLDGKFLTRTGMYADASRGTSEDMKRREAGRNGFTEEIRILGAADHCADCLAAAGHWEPLGTLPRIGESVCLTNCHCIFEFR